jgi:hypothetical protein
LDEVSHAFLKLLVSVDIVRRSRRSLCGDWGVASKRGRG